MEIQSAKYTAGLPDGLPAWRKPLPFSYQSTGVETRFTNGLDPEPRSRPVFAFHQPGTLTSWLDDAKVFETSIPLVTGNPSFALAADVAFEQRGRTFLERLRYMPPLVDQLWPPKPRAIANIEQSLRANRPRALVQMATGSGKTLLAIVLAYRLIKFAGARRILFLVDRGNLGDQIVEDLQAALEQFKEVAADLGAKEALEVPGISEAAGTAGED